MAATALSRLRGDKGLLAGRLRPILLVRAGLVVLLVAYGLSVVLRDGRYSVAVDGWLVDAFELALGGLCLERALRQRPFRPATLALGAAILSWSIADLCTTLASLGGRHPACPSIADLFYLAFYPSTYVAIVLYARAEARRSTSPSFLDGLVAGLGAAALCAAFAFHGVLLHTGSGALATATRFAFPIGDLLLVGLVFASTVVVASSRQIGWLVLVAACSLSAVGDTIRLFDGAVSLGSGAAAEIGALSRPAALLLISIALWIPPRRSERRQALRTGGFVLPGIFALAGLAILVVGTLRHVDLAALALATAAVLAAALRMGLSLSALRRITEHRHAQSLTDELTGLANRRSLFQLLDQFFAEQAAGGRLAFLFMDLNHFKEVNDSFGHPAGDELLRQVGPRLSPLLRKDDLLVRLGGDELAAVLIGAGEGEATGVAERLSRAFEAPFSIGRVRARVSASIGIALAPEHAESTDRLLRCADVAMYRAKLARLAYEVYDPGLDDAGDLLDLVDELRTAVAENQFVLHFQAQLDLHRGEVAAVEALVRWRHPRLGLIAPLKFLPLVEEAGLMPALTELVLDAALSQCAGWRGRGSELTVAVNVSASNLVDPGFTDLVGRLLDKHAVAPGSLVLEITETSIISDYDRARIVVDELRDLGVMVSIDDFGAGFTSLAYLGDLAVGELKLDRAFITALAGQGNGRERELVRSTISLGHALGMRVVAEGVEDPATLELLTGFGCDVVQGYLISVPMPGEDDPRTGSVATGTRPARTVAPNIAGAAAALEASGLG